MCTEKYIFNASGVSEFKLLKVDEILKIFIFNSALIVIKFLIYLVKINDLVTMIQYLVIKGLLLKFI